MIPRGVGGVSDHIGRHDRDIIGWAVLRMYCWCKVISLLLDLVVHIPRTIDETHKQLVKVYFIVKL